jgi:hypothetical protein
MEKFKPKMVLKRVQEYIPKTNSHLSISSQHGGVTAFAFLRYAVSAQGPWSFSRYYTTEKYAHPLAEKFIRSEDRRKWRVVYVLDRIEKALDEDSYVGIEVSDYYMTESSGLKGSKDQMYCLFRYNRDVYCIESYDRHYGPRVIKYSDWRTRLRDLLKGKKSWNDTFGVKVENDERGCQFEVTLYCVSK